jgi:hypothetical protein
VTNERTIEDLQAVSGHIIAATARLADLEAQKRTVDPGSERFRALSDEIEALAEDIRRVSAAEDGLAREVAGATDLPTVAEADAAKR